MRKSNRILIVDDNKSIHDDYRTILIPKGNENLNELNAIEDDLFGEPATADQDSIDGKTGYEVDSAYQGVEAIEMVRNAVAEGRPYAMAFMDVRMPPGIDGIETISRIWKEFPYTEMVICTAYSDYSLNDIVSRLGFTDRLLFLTKPFASIAVKHMAQSLVTKWNMGEVSRHHTLTLEQDVMERTRQLQEMLDDLNSKNRKLEETQAELRDTENKFHVLTSSSIDGIVLMDSKGRVSFWNNAAENMFGFTANEILGQELHPVITPERYHKDFKKGFQGFEKTGGGYFIGKNLELEGRKKDNTEFPVEISFSSLQVKENWYAAGIIRDITDRKELEKRMRIMAHYDKLTGLPNRTLFFERFAQFLSLAKRHNYVMAVLYFDLDNFKGINDNFGHDVGDRVLQEAAKRLGADLGEFYAVEQVHTQAPSTVALRESDTVARIGGDEFIILLSQISEKKDSIVVAERVIRDLSRSICIDNREFTLGVSVGISEFPHDGETMDTLIKSADISMYRAKDRGGNCYEMSRSGSENGNGSINSQTRQNQPGEEANK
jgi:PAS domain S-box-containing protein